MTVPMVDPIARLTRIAAIAPAFGDDGAWLAAGVHEYLAGLRTLPAALELPTRAGRHEIIDDSRIAEMRSLLSDGTAANIHQAATMVARTLCGPSSEDSIIRRLERIYAKIAMK